MRALRSGTLYGVNWELHPDGVTCYGLGGSVFSRFYVGYTIREAVRAFRHDVLRVA